MADFKRLYKLVDFVHGQNHKKLEDAELSQLQMNKEIGVHYVSESVCMRYMVDQCNLTRDQAYEVLESALSKRFGYLHAYRPYAGGERTLGVTYGSGMDFIKKFWFFRAGMWKDFQELYMPYTVAMSLIAIIISVVSIAVAIYAVNRK